MPKIRSKKRIIALLSTAASALLILGAISAKAATPKLAKPALITCTVTSGGVIIKRGDTCSGTGSGCEPNPC